MECGSGMCVLGVYLVKTLNKVICNRTADDNESTFLKPENESCHTKYWSHILYENLIYNFSSLTNMNLKKKRVL